MKQLAAWLKRVADICVGVGDEARLGDASDELNKIREEVKTLAKKFPVPGI